MACPRLIIITLFSFLILSKTEDITDNVGKNKDSLLLVSSVLDYLNSNSNGVYGFKTGSLLSAQNKADITEVTVEVNVDCLKKYPEIPCNEHVLICHAFIGQNPDQTYQVLSDVKCSPKIDIIVEDIDEVINTPMVYMEQRQGEMDKIDLSSEALSPAQGGADFVAVRKDNIPCLGCPFDLDSNAEGIEELINTAIKHIESEKSQRHKIIGVRKLQQQIVAGVKYVLLIEVAQTVCLKDADISAPCILDPSVNPFICEITFIEKPWISRSKHVIKNNCTVSQEFEPIDISKRDQDDMNNEILPHGGLISPTPQDKSKPIPNYDAIAQTGNMEEDMDAARLADLESQILFDDMFEFPKVSKVVQSPKNVMPFTVAQPEYVSVDEPSPITTAIDDDLKVEPLNVENRHIYRIPLFSSVPVIDESEPVVTMYHYQNDEPVKTSDENTVSKDNKNFEIAEFERYSPVQERFRREINGDSDSDSDSDGSSEESKDHEKSKSKKNWIPDKIEATVDIAKREVADTSEQSSESKNTSEKRQRVRREAETTSKESSESSESENTSEKRQRVKRKTDNTSEESSESSNTTEEKKRVKREAANSSDESDESHNSSEDKKRVKRKASNTSEESSESSNSTEENKKNTKAKRATDNNNDDSSSSSSSSSSSEEDNNHLKEEKSKKGKNESFKKNDDSSSSSSSSSSSNAENDNDIKRHRRSIGQMEKISSDEKVIVRDLADFAAATLDNIDDDHHKRVILQILGAKKLKLDGIYYQIILRLGISHCHENEHNENCREKLLTNLTKICKVQVHVDDDYSNPKVVKSQCQNIKKDENDRNRTNYSRYRRAVLVGGHTPISTSDPSVEKFVNATLNHLDSLSDQPYKHKAVEIISATSQVVAGIRYIVNVIIGLSDCAKSEEKCSETCGQLDGSEPKICKITIWDRPWLNKTIYHLNCNGTVSIFGDEEENARTKREAIVGGPEKISKDSEEVLRYLEKSLVYQDSKSEYENKYIVKEVLAASEQVVAGRLLRIRASVAISDCKKGSELKNCTILNDPTNKPIICKFKIWEKPWLNFTQTNITCNDKQKYSFRKRRATNEWNVPQILGADDELSTEHPEARNFIKMALEYLSSKSETPGKYELQNIKSVSRRVVAGALWNINADIALCRQIDLLRSAFSMCPDSSQHINCQFIVLNQPWLADGLTINITCENDDRVYTYMPVKGLNEESNIFDHKRAFKQFVRKYNKAYDENEYRYRLKVFRDNANKIALLNKYEKGTARYGFTQFADITEKEFSQGHGYRPDLRIENQVPFAQAKIPDIQLPKEFDWRVKGVVTKVKDQGLCGSCWAFSVTGNVEGQYAIKHGKLLEFSEQELVDCDKVDQGCNGGLMDSAYRVIEKLGGLETESDYPYEGDDEKCHLDVNKIQVELTGALNISHNETDMAKWLVQNGPISIAINANAMQFYMGGVSHPWKTLCNPKNLDHGVLIVGYGVHKYSLFNKTLPYWIVKNSWSSSWGEQGYYRVYRGDGTCGLNETPSSAIVA